MGEGDVVAIILTNLNVCPILSGEMKESGGSGEPYPNTIWAQWKNLLSAKPMSEYDSDATDKERAGIPFGCLLVNIVRASYFTSVPVIVKVLLPCLIRMQPLLRTLVGEYVLFVLSRAVATDCVANVPFSSSITSVPHKL